MTDLVKRLDDYLTELVTEEADAALLIDETIDEIERLLKRQELLEKVVEAATALDEYDDYYIHMPAEITLNKALEKTLTKLKESEA